MLEPNFTPFPTLETPRLRLVETTIEYADDFFALRSNDVIMQYIDRPRPKTQEDILALIEKINLRREQNEGIHWSLVLKGTNKMIGSIGYHLIEKENYRAEFGYLLHHDYWRQGYMSEAIEAALEYGFNAMGLNSIVANVNPENNRSSGILLKHKFHKDAYFKENFFWNGKFLDSEIYSLLKSEWK